MSFKKLISAVESSEIFKRFIQENSDAELVAGFFILDFVSNDEKESLDYLIPNTSKIFTFELNRDNDVTMKQDKLIDEPGYPKLEKISKNIDIEVEELKAIAEKQAAENKIFVKFHKIIAVLQMHSNKQTWNLTCLLENMIILNILIDCKTGEILKFERRSIMDIIKKI